MYPLFGWRFVCLLVLREKEDPTPGILFLYPYSVLLQLIPLLPVGQYPLHLPPELVGVIGHQKVAQLMHHYVFYEGEGVLAQP